MLLDVEHRMHFRYDGFIHQAQLELRVEPRSSEHQTVHSFHLAVGPPASVDRYVDWNENLVHHFGIVDYCDRVEILARSLVEVDPENPPLEELGDAHPADGGAALDFALFDGPIVRSAALEALDGEIATGPAAPLGEQIAAIGALIQERFRYEPGITSYQSTVDHVLAHRSGVCQDFAHLALALLRLRRIPCRYVSGYLHVDSVEGAPAQSHAWIEMLTRGRGWAPFDPTHDRVPDDRYVVVARGRHYGDVPPNRGIFRGDARETLEVEVHTRPAQRRDVVGLHEWIEELDVPVYRELPAAPRPPTPGAEEQPPGPREQQQQQ